MTENQHLKEEEHAWSEAGKASELVQSLRLEAEEARRATQDVIDERMHVQAIAKETAISQEEHIAKLKNEVLEMHKEITYLHTHLRHQKRT